MQKIEVLRRWLEEGERIVFFGGAGVSTESGIPDFRGVDGLYRQRFAHPPEEILSIGFYREKVLFPDALPNVAHRKLAEWERAGKQLTIITQNIDGLHQRAGSRSVLELHGSVHRNYCQNCGKRYGIEVVLESTGVPRCDCGGAIRPDVVLYGESLDCEVLGRAAAAIGAADLLIVGGTSLVVYPAAGLIDLYTGDRLAIINREGLSARADLTLRGSIGEVFSSL